MMTDHIKQIEELVAAGEKATPFELKFVCGFNVGVGSHEKTRDFIIKAANSRDALKELLAERNRYREALDKIESKSLQELCCFSGGEKARYDCVKNLNAIAKQALKGDV